MMFKVISYVGTGLVGLGLGVAGLGHTVNKAMNKQAEAKGEPKMTDRQFFIELANALRNDDKKK